MQVSKIVSNAWPEGTHMIEHGNGVELYIYPMADGIVIRTQNKMQIEYDIQDEQMEITFYEFPEPSYT